MFLLTFAMRHPEGFAYEFSLKFHIVVSRSTTKLNTYTTHQYVSVITVPQYQLLNPHIRLPGLFQVLDRRNSEDLHLKVIRSVRLSNLLSRFTSLTMCRLVKMSCFYSFFLLLFFNPNKRKPPRNVLDLPCECS